MARKLEVLIVGDASSLERSLGQAGRATSKLGNVAKIAGAAIAGGLAYGLTKSVEAAIKAQQSQARLAQSFKVAGLSAAASAGQIDKAEASSRRLGFTDEDVRNSLGSLITATGDVGKSMADLSVAQDVARFKGIDLADSTKMITMAMTGSQRAAKQLGIAVSPLTTSYDALKATMGKSIDPAEKLRLVHAKLLDKMATGQAVIDAVSAKVKGQARAFADTAAGGMAQFHAQLSKLEVSLGDVFLPVIGKAASGFAGFLDKINRAQGASAKFRVVGDTFVAVAREIEGSVGRILKGYDKVVKGGEGGIGATTVKVPGLGEQITSQLGKVDWGAVGKKVLDGIIAGISKGQELGDALVKTVSKALDGVDTGGTWGLSWGRPLLAR